MNKNSLAIILAAGKGSRMESNLPKPLIPLAGKPMIGWIVDTLKLFPFIDICIIVGYKSSEIKAFLGDDFIYVYQNKQKGTADAVKMAIDVISRYQDTLILPSDSPMISKYSIDKLYKTHSNKNAKCSFLTSFFPFNLPYARVIRENNLVVNCIEEIDLNIEDTKINEYFTSHYLLDSSCLIKYLDQIKLHDITKEYHLTEIIKLFSKNKCIINDIKIKEYKELMGINTKKDLEFIESWITSNDK